MTKGNLNFSADEVRIDVDLGDTLMARFPVIDYDDDSDEDLSAYTLEGAISWPGFVTPLVALQLTKSTNVVSMALTQADIETLYAANNAWNYEVRIRKAGERRRIAFGVLVIHS